MRHVVFLGREGSQRSNGLRERDGSRWNAMERDGLRDQLAQTKKEVLSTPYLVGSDEYLFVSCHFKLSTIFGYQQAIGNLLLGYGHLLRYRYRYQHRYSIAGFIYCYRHAILTLLSTHGHLYRDLSGIRISVSFVSGGALDW